MLHVRRKKKDFRLAASCAHHNPFRRAAAATGVLGRVAPRRDVRPITPNDGSSPAKADSSPARHVRPAGPSHALCSNPVSRVSRPDTRGRVRNVKRVQNPFRALPAWRQRSPCALRTNETRARDCRHQRATSASLDRRRSSPPDCVTPVALDRVGGARASAMRPSRPRFAPSAAVVRASSRDVPRSRDTERSRGHAKKA